MLRVVASARFTEFSDLEKELAVRGELQYEVTAPADPDVAAVVDIQCMLTNWMGLTVDS